MNDDIEEGSERLEDVVDTATPDLISAACLSAIIRLAMANGGQLGIAPLPEHLRGLDFRLFHKTFPDGTIEFVVVPATSLN